MSTRSRARVRIAARNERGPDSGRRDMSSAIVVGAGPNGLAAAVALAKAGLQVTVLEAADEIGGGTRTSEAIMPGLLHDHCSAIHPMAVGSQFLARSRPRPLRVVMAAARNRLRPPARRRQRGCAVSLRRDHRRRVGLRRCPVAQAVRQDVGQFRCAVRGHHGSAAASAAPSVDTGAVWRADRAARIRPCPVVSQRGGPGIVRRCCGARLSATALPDDIGDRPGHSHRGPPPRMAGGGGRVTVDHQRARGAAVRPRRQDRNGHPDRDRLATAARRCHDVRPGARSRRRHSRRPPAAPSRPRLPEVQAGARRIQGRLRGGRWRPVDQPVGPARPAPFTSWAATPNSPPPSATSTRDACRSARSCWSVNSTWPTRNAPSATSTRCGRTPMCPNGYLG